MKKIVFLLEEPSMKEFLDAFLPRLLPDLDFVCVKHEGKRDLEKSIPRKLRAWQGVEFVVVRDNDNAACRRVKARLKALCAEGKKPETLVRIACQELEAWYLGSLPTVASVYGKAGLVKLARKAELREPDRLGSPSQLMAKLVPEFQKLDGARRMGASMPAAEAGSKSRSFQVFVSGVLRLVAG
jgi:hypothetical protein